MQVPPGHMVQQILDQNGTLQHVILSLDPMAAASTTQQQFAVPMSPYVSTVYITGYRRASGSFFSLGIFAAIKSVPFIDFEGFPRSRQGPNL